MLGEQVEDIGMRERVVNETKVSMERGGEEGGGGGRERERKRERERERESESE